MNNLQGEARFSFFIFENRRGKEGDGRKKGGGRRETGERKRERTGEGGREE